MAEFGSNALEGLAASTISTLVGLHSPFSNYMEAPGQIIALRSRFGDAIDEGLRRTAESLVDLLCGVLAELHGIPDDRTIGDGDLVACGFDPSSQWPDELDYW